MALAGMVFVITGQTSTTRAALSQKIKQADGVVSGSLSKKVTHIVCGAGFEETDKFLKYKKSDGKLRAVTEAFLDACIKAHKNSKSSPPESEFNPETQAPEEEVAPNEKTEDDEDPEKETVEDEVLDKETEEDEAQEVEEGEAQDGTQEEAQEKVQNEKAQENADKTDDPADVVAPEGEKIKKAKRTPRKAPRPHKQAVNNALRGWVVYISGASKAKDELKDFIEEHGGTVTGSNYASVTHILEEFSSGKHVPEMVGLGAVIIAEDFMRETVNEFKPPKSLVPSSPAKGKKKKIVEKVISRRPYKGEMHYVVQYIGLDDEENELLSHEDVLSRGGEKALKKFESYWKKEMNVFNFTKSQAGKTSTAPKGSPRKKEPETKKTKRASTSEKNKSSPKKKDSKEPRKTRASPKKSTPIKKTTKKRKAAPSPKASPRPTKRQKK